MGAYYEDSNQTGITNTDDTASSDNSAEQSGAVYVFKKDSNGDWYQDAYLKPTNTGGKDSNSGENGDYFGYSVAVYDNTIVVGAIREDSNQTEITNIDGSDVGSGYCQNGNEDDCSDDYGYDSGAVYVFRKDGDNWVQDAYLKASNADSKDYFGYSVAVYNDTIVVGAYYEDAKKTSITNTDDTASSNNGAKNSGAVYVFKKKSNGDWYQDAYLKPSNAARYDNFGKSVAIYGDMIVVGAIGEDSDQTTITNTDGHPIKDYDNNTDESNDNASGSGAVYVFKEDSNGNWVQDAYLKTSNTDSNDYFGNSVAIYEDTIVVGAYLEDSNQTSITNTDGHPTKNESNNDATYSGAVYIFKMK